MDRLLAFVSFAKQTTTNPLTFSCAFFLSYTLTVAEPAEAGTTVYKCLKDGQVILTDKPCATGDENGTGNDAPSTHTGNSVTVVPSSKNPSPVGQWSGQLQYQEAINAQTVQEAHSVASMTAVFTEDGKVTGISKENGCKMLGVWGGGLGASGFLIDVTFSNCSVDDMNRRFHGSFLLAHPDSSGSFQLNSFGAPFSKDMAKTFDIKGTLRRA